MISTKRFCIFQRTLAPSYCLSSVFARKTTDSLQLKLDELSMANNNWSVVLAEAGLSPEEFRQMAHFEEPFGGGRKA